MRQVVSRNDALEKAYDAGLLVGKGTMKVEGIGDRSTNWGRGMTLTVKGATLSQARLAVGWFADKTNCDARNNRNGDCLTLRLTTFREGRQFASRLGLSGQVDKAVASVTSQDALTGAKERYWANGGRLEEGTCCEEFSLADHNLESLVAVCESLMGEMAVKEWVAEKGGRAVEGLFINAFMEGERGLALGSSDEEALLAGEGILDRYARTRAA